MERVIFMKDNRAKVTKNQCEEQVLDMLHAKQQSRRQAEIYLGGTRYVAIP